MWGLSLLWLAVATITTIIAYKTGRQTGYDIGWTAGLDFTIPTYTALPVKKVKLEVKTPKAGVVVETKGKSTKTEKKNTVKKIKVRKTGSKKTK